MVEPDRKTRTLETAFREAGLGDVRTSGDGVHVRLDASHELGVRAVSAGHGRPQEVKDAILRVQHQRPAIAYAVVAEHFTPGAIDVLREANVNHVDDRRFYFRNDQPFVAIKQDRTAAAERKPTKGTKLAGKVGVGVQCMLLDNRDWWSVTELAQAAHIAAGTAQTALHRLEDLELVRAEGVGPGKRRRIVDRAAILERWAQDARRERHRLMTAFVLGQGPVNVARRVSTQLQIGRVAHAVTGACGALLVAPHATGARLCEVWVDPDVGLDTLAHALGVEPVEKGGNVVVLQTRTDAPMYDSSPVEGVVVANPLRLYADLLEDPRRGEEQAAFLRETKLRY